MSRNNTNTNPTGGVEEFIELTDCPNTHNPPNSYVVTNGAGTAIVYSVTPPTGATKFVQLTDTPMSITANEYVIGNPAGNALIFTAVGPPESFLSLTDTPNSYAGQANNTVQVNNSETGLVFNNVFTPHRFTELLDTPNTLIPNNQIVVNGTGTALINQAQPAVPNQVFQGAFLDVPNNYGVGGQMLTSTGIGSVWTTPVRNFNDLADVSDDIIFHPNQVVTVNNAGTQLVYTNKSNTTLFTQLTDCPNSYVGQADKFVKVNLGETGLNFVTGGGGGDSLISLTDNTAGAYTSANINECISINQGATGFNYQNMAYLQGGYPRLVHGMIKGYRNYPSPHEGGFVYDSTGSEGGFFYFGTNRTNFNEPRFLNDYWTTENQTGGSCFYPLTGDNTTLDLSPKFVGIGGTAHSCGANLKVPNTINIVAPFANNWYFDVLVNISWRIDIGNIDDNIFVMWVCSKQQMDNIISFNSDFDQVRKADYWWVNENGQDPSGRVYPNSVSEGHISKVVTFQCGSGSTFPDINVFMSARNKTDYSERGTFTIRSYYYINCSYAVLAMRAPKVGVDEPDLTNIVPGIFW